MIWTKRLILGSLLSYTSCVMSAVPDVPFPAGNCAGIIPIDDPEQMETDNSYIDGIANISFIIDFDNAQLFGVAALFDDYDGDNERLIQWSFDQDSSGNDAKIERDDLMPASFLATFSIDLPDDRLTPINVTRPTGNAFQEVPIKVRLLPVGSGSSYIIQGVNIPYHGFCTAI